LLEAVSFSEIEMSVIVRVTSANPAVRATDKTKRIIKSAWPELLFLLFIINSKNITKKGKCQARKSIKHKKTQTVNAKNKNYNSKLKTCKKHTL